MGGRREATARCGRLLLLAALLLGIVTMHTLGHPGGHGGAPHQAAAPAAHTMPMAAPALGGSHATPPPHDGLDPSSVCLAVLGAGWEIVVLLLALAALRRPVVEAVAARAWFVRALWPFPPPVHQALARLSVLRV